MEFLVTDFDVLSELRVLNIDSELVLKYVDVLLQKSNLPHQIFVGLVLLDVAKLFSQNLHLFFDHWENKNLLIFVQLAITTLVEHLEELLRGLNS